MKKEKYLSDRKALLDAAQALLDEGKLRISRPRPRRSKLWMPSSRMKQRRRPI